MQEKSFDEEYLRYGMQKATGRRVNFIRSLLLLPSGKSGPKLLPRLAASLSLTKGRMDEEGSIGIPKSHDRQRDDIAESEIARTPKKRESAD